MEALTDIHPDDTLDWLVSVLGGPADGPPLPMLARPGRSEPAMLLPLTSRRVGAASLRRHHDGRSRSDRIRADVAQLVAQAGLLDRIGGNRVELPSTVLLETLREALGQPDLVAAIGLGPARRNRKPVLMLITPRGRVAAYVKVGWSRLTRDLVDNEERWLRRLDGRIASPFRTPVALARIESATALAVVASPLQVKRVRRPRPVRSEDIAALARSLGSRSRRVADLPWLADPRWGEATDRTEDELRAAVAGVRDRHADVAVETGLWHGDLNIWNRVTLGGQIGLVDWEFAGDDRPVGQDGLHIEFETIRRSGRFDPAGAVAEFVDRRRTRADAQTRALLDVYLADLAIRESRLTGQGWDGPMAGYRRPLTDALTTGARR